MSASSQVIWFWVKDKAGGLYLSSREVISSEEGLAEDFALEINRIASDAEALPFRDGLQMIFGSGRLTLPDDDPPPLGQASVVTQVPVCPDHKESMQVSKFLSKGAFASYFCNRKDQAGFCKCSADVMSDGSVRHKRKQ